MATHVELPPAFISSKRGIISDVARTFDVLGWISPAILPMKVLFQELWERQLGWDDEVPDVLREKHTKWREELPLLASIRLPRCYHSEEPALSITLHGFCDASETAYAAVVYLRTTYDQGPVTCRLVLAKTKVAPVKTLSIPRLGLCGANLLAKILSSTRDTLNLPTNDVHAWCDSTIVLAWLDGAPKRHKTYEGNIIANITSLIPSVAWRHVPTHDNPADCASRGLTPKELKFHDLWWNGPSWLYHQPVSIPKQPNKAELCSVQDTEAKPVACNVVVTSPVVWLEHRFSSMRTLLHVTAWVLKAAHNFLAPLRGHQPIRSNQFTTDDLNSADVFLIKSSQQRAFPVELTNLCSVPPKSLSPSSRLLMLHPFLGQDGLLHVGGCLSYLIHKNSLSSSHPMTF